LPGVPALMVGAEDPVTESRLGQMELGRNQKEEAEHWDRIFDSLPAGLAVHSADGVILSVNKRLEQIYDRTAEAFVGRKCDDLFHLQSVECPHDKVMASKGHAEATIAIGSKTYEVIITALVDSGGAVRGFTRTMIEQIDRAAAKTLVKADRFGTLEQMISGIAHDVGTPLGIISGYCEYLLMRSKTGEPGHKELSTILQQTRRIADSIKQMVDLVRPSSGRIDAIGLKGFLTELLDVMGHHLRRASVTAYVSCCANPPLIYGDGPKLRRAFFDIVINAVEQVGPGGNIELTLSEVPAHHDLAKVVVAGTAGGGVAIDLGKSFSGILGDKPDSEVAACGLSLTREILKGFKAVIETADLGDRGVGLSIDLPVGGRENSTVSAP
jgi:two-component system sensor histidine kinase HydH